MPHGTASGDGEVGLHLFQHLVPHEAAHMLDETRALLLLPALRKKYWKEMQDHLEKKAEVHGFERAKDEI